jgi:hypothetical protein
VQAGAPIAGPSIGRHIARGKGIVAIGQCQCHAFHHRLYHRPRIRRLIVAWLARSIRLITTDRPDIALQERSHSSSVQGD